ncbi:MAG: hypothetical protein K0R17_1557 [Rariglobus sp.]|nr:hypothetical protein [Rariglobus sp.]
MLAIEVAKSAQPVLAGAGGDRGDDPDAPDEEAGVVVQVGIPGVEAAAGPGNAMGAGGGGSAFDDDGPVWPDEAQESGMRAEVAERGETLSSRAAREAADAAAEAAAEKKNLPSLDELVERIPADVRDTLEDLFRVKFVKVTRVPKKVLKG